MAIHIVSTDSLHKSVTLTTAQVAEVLEVTPDTLKNWRRTATGPRFTRSGRSIQYEVGAVEYFVEWIIGKFAKELSQLADHARTGRGDCGELLETAVALNFNLQRRKRLHALAGVSR